MPVFLELRNGHTGFDLSSGAPGELGPLLGPFIAVRLIRDEVRVTTLEREFPLERVADWIFYAGKFYSDAEIVPLEQMGSGRNRRRRPFDPALAAIDGRLRSPQPGCQPPLPNQNQGVPICPSFASSSAR
jgi:hypothetical protein